MCSGNYVQGQARVQLLLCPAGGNMEVDFIRQCDVWRGDGGCAVAGADPESSLFVERRPVLERRSTKRRNH